MRQGCHAEWYYQSENSRRKFYERLHQAYNLISKYEMTSTARNEQYHSPLWVPISPGTARDKKKRHLDILIIDTPKKYMEK